MAAALAQPAFIPIGAIKSFGPYGPEYEVVGPAQPERGKSMVQVIIVRTGEVVLYEYDAMMQDPKAT